jgi:meso-butanediol dehydrogenase/(S,S)-butanediol dehydrogenase/diacetyl reductase
MHNALQLVKRSKQYLIPFKGDLNMQRFQGKTILVTGAASGIGAATVRRILEEGGRVAAADLRQADVEQVLAACGAGDRAQAYALDIADEKQAQGWVAAAVAHFGAIDGLVNCAGIRGVGQLVDFDRAGWDRVLAVNLEGTVNTLQAFALWMRQANRPGAVVNLTSMAGIVGVPNRLAYVASKFGVAGITRAIALELAPFGIRVNAIAPGMIRTPMTSVMFEDAENEKRIRAAHPIGREGRPEEIASAIAFLMSDDASFMTGVIVPVDGGATAGAPSH